MKPNEQVAYSAAQLIARASRIYGDMPFPKELEWIRQGVIAANTALDPHPLDDVAINFVTYLVAANKPA